MSTAFSQQIIINRETNIELVRDLQGFADKMEAHIEKYPSYTFNIEMLGGEPGRYSARVILTKHGNNKEIEIAEGDSGAYGIL